MNTVLRMRQSSQCISSQIRSWRSSRICSATKYPKSDRVEGRSS